MPKISESGSKVLLNAGVRDNLLQLFYPSTELISMIMPSLMFDFVSHFLTEPGECHSASFGIRFSHFAKHYR